MSQLFTREVSPEPTFLCRDYFYNGATYEPAKKIIFNSENDINKPIVIISTEDGSVKVFKEPKDEAGKECARVFWQSFNSESKEIIRLLKEKEKLDKLKKDEVYWGTTLANVQLGYKADGTVIWRNWKPNEL
jgi:hypothetical protein